MKTMPFLNVLSLMYYSILFLGGLRLNTAFSSLPLKPRSTQCATFLLPTHHQHDHCHSVTKSTLFLQQQGQSTNNNNNNDNTANKKYVATTNKYKKQNPSKYNKNRNSKFNDHKTLNKNIMHCNDVSELLTLIGTHSDCAIYHKLAGGGAFDGVNFSTSIHRLAKLVTNQQQRNLPRQKLQSPKDLISNPYFALLICSITEALSTNHHHQQGNKNQSLLSIDRCNFEPRACANIIWSIAKLQIAPTQYEYPLQTSSLVYSKAAQQCAELRNKIHDGITKHQYYNYNNSNNNNNIDDKSATFTILWIPELQKVCGLLVDMISYKASQIEDPSSLRSQECSNMLWAVAKMQRSDSKMMTNVVDKLIQVELSYAETDSVKQQEVKPQHVSNSLWSLAKSGTYLEPAEQLIQFVAKLLVPNPLFLDESSPQCLSNNVWSIATLLSKQSSQELSDETNIAALAIMRYTCKEVIKRKASGFQSQEVSNTAWALATVGFGALPMTTTDSGGDGNYSNDMIIKHSNNEPTREEEDHTLMSDTINILVERTNHILHHFNGQDISNMVWAMARLGQKDEIFLKQLGWVIADSTRNELPQGFSMTLWALAKLEIYDNDMYKKIASRFISMKSRTLKPQEISNILWALARANIVPENQQIFETTLPLTKKDRLEVQNKAFQDPITSCFAIGAQELMSRPFQYEAQDISNILWSLVTVGVRHPDLFRSMAIHLVGQVGGNKSSDIRGLHQFLPQGISNLAWAHAKHAQIGGKIVSSSNSPLSDGKLSTYLISSLDIGDDLQQHLFTEFAKAGLDLYDNLSGFDPQTLSNTVWSFATLGLKHDSYLNEAQVQVLDRIKAYLHENKRNSMTIFTKQDISNFLWGLARLSKPLIPGLMDEISHYIVETCKDHETGDISITSSEDKFDRNLLGSLAWACAVHNEYPPELIKIIYMGLLGDGCDKPFDPTDLTETIYNNEDDNANYGWIRSLLYLQVAMDLDGSNNDSTIIALPKNFPNSWIKSSTDSNNSNEENNDDGFTLSSSKVQKEVNLAFDRIGFDHVDEYVMDLEMLVNEYGITSIAGSSFKMLSMDLANIDEKIAIEVGGPSHFLTSLNNIIDQDVNDKPMQSKSTILQKASRDGSKFGLSTWNRQEFNGGTKLKHRILEKLGWKVISVRVWDWYELGGDAKKEDDFCRLLLERK